MTFAAGLAVGLLVGIVLGALYAAYKIQGARAEGYLVGVADGKQLGHARSPYTTVPKGPRGE